jgi:hypothetical protein
MTVNPALCMRWRGIVETILGKPPVVPVGHGSSEQGRYKCLIWHRPWRLATRQVEASKTSARSLPCPYWPGSCPSDFVQLLKSRISGAPGRRWFIWLLTSVTPGVDPGRVTGGDAWWLPGGSNYVVWGLHSPSCRLEVALACGFRMWCVEMVDCPRFRSQMAGHMLGIQCGAVYKRERQVEPHCSLVAIVSRPQEQHPCSQVRPSIPSISDPPGHTLRSLAAKRVTIPPANHGHW